MKTLKRSFYFFVFILLLIFVLVIFSPYGHRNGFETKVVIESIVINKSPEEVYDYLGNSDNAKDWSSYVDHITPINPELYKDGEIGAKRKCFKNKNEQGAQWDEEILISERSKKRRLSIYNASGFTFMAHNLVTEQIYEETNGQCKLSFTLFVEEGKNTFFADLKIYLAAYFIAPIFEKNIMQVKELLEN